MRSGLDLAGRFGSGRRRTACWPSLIVVVAVLGIAGDRSSAKPVPSVETGPQAWIGVGIKAGQNGVAITDVVDDSPAFVAGLRVRDEIVAVDRLRVMVPNQLIRAISGRPVGTVVTLKIQRGDLRFTIDLALEEMPSPNQLLRRRLVGKPAPDFDLPVVGDSDGRHQLADLRGQVVVIDFFATWCQACLANHAALAELTRRHADDGLVALAISGETTAILEAYLGRAKPSLPVLRDADGVIHGRYFASQIPTLVVVDRDGVVVFAGTAESPPPGMTTADTIAANFADGVFAAERALRRRPGDRELLR